MKDLRLDFQLLTSIIRGTPWPKCNFYRIFALILDLSLLFEFFVELLLLYTSFSFVPNGEYNF